MVLVHHKKQSKNLLLNIYTKRKHELKVLSKLMENQLSEFFIFIFMIEIHMKSIDKKLYGELLCWHWNELK